MISRLGTLLVALVTLATGRAGAAAEPADVAMAVLALEAHDGTDLVAAELTEALRQRVAGTPGYDLVQGKDLVEIKLVFSCADEAPACMAQAGKSLGASKMLFGSVKRLGADLVITLKLLDVARTTVESSLTEAVVKKRADSAGVRPLAAKWLTRLTGKPGNGSLHVRANVVGAAVTLDGVSVGVTGQRPFTINDVSAGRHELAATKSGYTTTKQEFKLAAGQNLPLSLALSPLTFNLAAANEPVPVTFHDGAGDSDGGRTMARAGFWTALVGAGASAALAYKFGTDVRRINRDLDPYRRHPCTDSPTGLCNDNKEPANELTFQERTESSQLTDDGNRAQTLQWVFIGLVPPFAIAGGFLLYKGYLESEGGSKTSHNRGPRIFPTASASAGGIVAEFDF